MNKNKLRYKGINGTNYAVLKAKNKGGQCITERCIFCGNRHIHSPENGHRVAHCDKRSVHVKTQGVWLHNDDGYIVEIEKT